MFYHNLKDSMKRKRDPFTLWEAAIPTNQATNEVWTCLHSNIHRPLWFTSASKVKFVTGQSWHESVDAEQIHCQRASSVKSAKVDADDDCKGGLTTFVVGLCLTSKQKSVVNQMLVIEKMAFRFACTLFANTPRGRHLLDYNSKDKDISKATRAAVKGHDRDGQKLERLSDVWSYVQKCVVQKHRNKCLQNLRPEHVHLLPPEQYHTYAAGIQPKLSGINRMKAAVAATWKKIRAFSQAADYDVPLEGITGSCLVQKQYCRPVKDRDDAPACQRRHIVLLPDIMSGSNIVKRIPWDVRCNRFLRLTKNVADVPPFDHDMKIVKTGPSKYRLHIPCTSSWTRRKCRKTEDHDSAVCSIDPGCRTFATIYDPTRNLALAYGTQQQRKVWLEGLFAKQDGAHAIVDAALKRLKAERTPCKLEGHRRQLLQAQIALRKIGLCIRNKVTGIHRTLVGHLASRYHTVVLGKIGVGNIVRKDRNNPLMSQTNRRLLAWCHYRFRQRLLQRSMGDDSLNVYVQDESYTSCTCGMCNMRKKNLGSNDVFSCTNCGYRTDRDVNGARNILRKFCGLM